MPPELAKLLALFLEDIANQADAIGADRRTIDQWQQQMAQSLLAFHYAAYMDGRGSKDLGRAEQARINKLVGSQLDYLNRFAAELDQRGWRDADAARAALYAGSIKASFWRGKTFGYELPAYPTEGSECMVNCRCFWEMDEHDREELNADFYWRMGAAEHCPTCVQRAQDWAPLKFRGGEQV